MGNMGTNGTFTHTSNRDQKSGSSGIDGRYQRGGWPGLTIAPNLEGAPSKLRLGGGFL
jgi:hypothetical protein